jgi:DNA-directed RNA polymerase subunit H (RpoH/RPB5)
MESFSLQNDKIDEVMKELLVARKYTDIKREEDEEYRFSCFDGDQKILVTYMFNKKKLPVIFKKFIANFDGMGYKHIIVLYKKPSTLFKKVVKSFNVELFCKSFLGFNITKHELVPEHKLIKKNSDEIEVIKENYQLFKLDQLPIILDTDPISKFYGANAGDVFSIKKRSRTNGFYTSYRYVDKPVY